MALAMVSLSVGVVGCYVPILISSSSWEWRGAISLSLAIFWAGAFVSSLVRFGKKGTVVLCRRSLCTSVANLLFFDGLDFRSLSGRFLWFSAEGLNPPNR
jgi:hypothetical protein